MKRLNKQKGFTIIELVVVILLLGILTATALPRFMDVTEDAHAAVVSAVVGGIGTGNALYKAQWFADNQPTTVTLFGGLTANPRNGYPIGIKANSSTAASYLTTAASSGDCMEVFQNVLQPAGQPTIRTITSASGAMTAFTATQIPAGYDFITYLQTGSSVLLRTCNFIYTGQYTDRVANAVPVIQYNIGTGAVTTTNI